MIIKDQYKIIVVGSGPGGSVSSMLFAEKGYDVLLIEAGGYYKQEEIPPFTSEEMHKKYKDGGLTLAFGNTNINYVEGSCVGGGSEVNSGLYHRLPENILANWEKKNNLVFDRRFLDESYKQIEKDISVSYMPDKPDKASLKLMFGSKKLDWECNEIPRWYKYQNDKNGQKQTMSLTYIPKFLKSGGQLLPNAKVLKIRKDGKMNEVIVLKEGNISKLKCEFLFLSAGAIGSPHLLRRSGIKGLVGQGLKAHPSFKFTALFNQNIYSKKSGVAVHQIKEFSPKISMGSSISNKPYIAMALNDSNNLNYLKDWKKMTNFYVMISPEGKGSIYNLPIFNKPIVTYNLTSNDYYNLNKGISLLAKVLFEAGAEKLFPSCKFDGALSEYEEVYRIQALPKKKLNLITIHLFCSVQLAGDKSKGPLHGDGYLWDDQSIYVNDGSILIDSPTVNPQGIIMALTRMNAIRFINNLNNEI
tara:strand:+ start:1941 stop:3356 length:1416 start_codon:yes stop_codon:yes gene_type:complete